MSQASEINERHAVILPMPPSTGVQRSPRQSPREESQTSTAASISFRFPVRIWSSSVEVLWLLEALLSSSGDRGRSGPSTSFPIQGSGLEQVLSPALVHSSWCHCCCCFHHPLHAPLNFSSNSTKHTIDTCRKTQQASGFIWCNHLWQSKLIHPAKHLLKTALDYIFQFIIRCVKANF